MGSNKDNKRAVKITVNHNFIVFSVKSIFVQWLKKTHFMLSKWWTLFFYKNLKTDSCSTVKEVIDIKPPSDIMFMFKGQSNTFSLK